MSAPVFIIEVNYSPSLVHYWPPVTTINHCNFSATSNEDYSNLYQALHSALSMACLHICQCSISIHTSCHWAPCVRF